MNNICFKFLFFIKKKKKKKNLYHYNYLIFLILKISFFYQKKKRKKKFIPVDILSALNSSSSMACSKIITTHLIKSSSDNLCESNSQSVNFFLRTFVLSISDAEFNLM